MSKRIITINRMYGSNGRKIGKALSEELGIHCYDRELIRIASDKAGLPYEELLKVDEKRASKWRYPLEEPAQMAPQYRLSDERRTFSHRKRDNRVDRQPGRLCYYRPLRRTDSAGEMFESIHPGAF